MKYLRRRWWVLAGGIASFLFVFFFFGGVDALQQCVDKYPHQTGHDDYGLFRLSVIANVHCFYGFFHDNGEAFVALGTIGLAFFTYRLWRATAVLARDTSDAAEKQIDRMEKSIKHA